MAKSGSIIGQITEELGELGKKIVTETVKVPLDIVAPQGEKKQKPIEQEVGHQEPVAPRQMLEQFARKAKPVPSIFEKKNMEETERKETAKKQAAASAWQRLPNTGAAPKRGDLRNVTKKAAGTETAKNVVNQ